MALCAFIDIEGAFDNTSHASITRSLEERNINASLIRWTQSMLKSRIIVATLGGETVKMTAEKGCPQGGVLSPLLWSLVVDDLLVNLHESGFTTQGYADDLVVTIRGKHDGVISDRMQLALNIIRSWCAKEGLNVNPSKTVLVPFTKRRKYELKAPTLNGIQLTFSKEVKYLGVVIDHKLTWNSQINHILSRATAASWTCRRVFGKTWGLKPKMIYWSYQTIIKPMVTYASLVWWPKIQQISAQVKLQKVQRLACLGITGAIFTCPTAALEVMLNLPPLHVCVMKEAANSAFRLSQTKNLKAGNLIGHLKILEHISLEAMSKPTDFMPNRYDFEMQFEVVINSHQTCTENGPQLGRDASVWYTDGSKMDERVGVGVTGPNFRLSKPLGNTPTIFQAEVHAIELCAQECLERGTRREKIYILSDSQAALKALRSYTCESKLTWDCKQSLRQLAANNQVTLMWVPGHRGIKGNEEADCLAKEGANTQFPGPEPFCGLSKAHLKEEFRRWETDEMKSHWNKVPGQRQAKRLVCLSPKKAKQLLELDKKDLKMVTGLLTGHCPLGYHLKKMGKSESDSCRYCENFAETAEHLLCECPALFCKRLKFLEGAFLTPSDIRKLAPRKLINFIRSLGIPGLE